MKIKKDTWYRITYKDLYYEDGQAHFTCRNAEVNRTLDYLKQNGLELLNVEEISPAEDTAYSGADGLKLRTADTGKGWNIRTSEDIYAYLLSFQYFQTVARENLEAAVQEAVKQKGTFDNARTLAQWIADNCI